MQPRDEKGRFCRLDSKLDEYSYVAGFKAFNSDLTCRDKQYKEGETFTEDKAIMCTAGMHYCINPLDVFSYYSLFDLRLGISKVANVTGKVKYRDVINELDSSYIVSKVVTTELRIDKVWNVLDYLKLYAPEGIQYRGITYYKSDSDILILNGANTAHNIVVDKRETFVLHNAYKELLTNATKNYLYMDDGIVFCAKKRALLEFTGGVCGFAGVAGVQYRLRDTEGKILFEGYIGNVGDLLPNTMYRFKAKENKLTIVGKVRATHL